MNETVVDRMVAVLRRGDTDGAWELLHSLDGDELRQARDWFTSNRRWLNTLASSECEGETHDDRFRNSCEAEWIVAMCALRFCGAVTAAKRVPWRRLCDYWQCAGEAAFVHMLWDAEATWVAHFVDAASQVSLGGNARNVNWNLSRVLRAAVVHHSLPAPTGRTFLAAWQAGTGQGSHVERLSRDPLMPDVLFHYLASGHCGQDPWLPEAVAELARVGRLERTVLIEHVLSLLTAPQRPASQRVLAEIIAALDVRAEEIPGGLTFLTGVLSTSSGAVGKVLLPHALQLVTDGQSLLELTTVVAGRPERKQKEVLLAGLRSEDLIERAGRGAALEAMHVLGAGDDAAFSAKVTRAVKALGGEQADVEAAQSVAGLWDLAPDPSGEDHRPWWWSKGLPSWDRLLDSRWKPQAVEQPWLIDLTLAAMAAGTFGDGAELREPAIRLVGRGRLASSRLTGALNDLFLAGGLRQAWPVAMSIADAACTAPRPPAGLPELLRMLASYAVEVPRQELPPGITELAAGEGHSKARTEARRLGATLMGTSPDQLVSELRAAPRSVIERPVVRGLWTVDDVTDPLPSETRLQDLSFDLAGLREALSADFNYYSQSHGDVSYWPPGYSPLSEATDLTYPDRVLAATVRAIHENGADAVRQSLTGIERQYPPLDVVAAIDLWVAGRLDVPMFWRLARFSVTHHEVTQVWRDDPTISPTELRERSRALPRLGQEVTAEEGELLILPAALDTPAARLTFLRACESLLLACDTPVTLSAPTWADGTLDFDDLLDRLKTVNGAPVGPLDLVQSLYRLRPVDVARLAELDLGPLPTEAAVTDPEGIKTWDAVEVVRAWVGSGGLPPLEPFADGDKWRTSATAPVPWSLCAAVPTDLREGPWSPGTMVETVRLMPLWGDRTIADAHQPWWYYDPRFFPGRIAGPFGVPLHDRLLALMTLTEKRQIPQAMATVLDVARHDRLVPEMAAAAAVGRHHAGSLAVGRLAQSFALAFGGGGLSGTWPSALAIADVLCGVRGKPSGLPELLRLLAAYAHEVPEPEVPEGLRRFAEGRGSSRSHVEARALVAALESA